MAGGSSSPPWLALWGPCCSMPPGLPATPPPPRLTLNLIPPPQGFRWSCRTWRRRSKWLPLGLFWVLTASAFHETPSKMTGHLSAKTSGTGNVLSISCKMPTAAAAQHCAATAAASYVAFRDQVTSSATSQAHNPLNVTLVTPASLPTAAAGPGKKILLPIGAILGLMLGIGAIFVRDHFDGRVRDGADLERCLDAPVLGGIPHLRTGGGDRRTSPARSRFPRRRRHTGIYVRTFSSLPTRRRMAQSCCWWPVRNVGRAEPAWRPTWRPPWCTRILR